MYTTNAKIASLITTTQDIDTMITVASKMIDAYVGYKMACDFDTAPKDYFFDGRGQKDLFLYGYYQKQGLTVDIDGVVTETVMYPLNDDATNQITIKSGVFTKGNGNITLLNAKKGRFTLDWGGSEHTLPSEVETACIMIVTALNKKLEGGVSDSGVKSSETIGSYSISFDTSEVTLDNSDVAFVGAKSILDDYQIISIA